jgi:uncharacterized protein YjdB
LLSIQKKISILLIMTLLISLFDLIGGPATQTAFAATGDKPLKILEIKDLERPSSGEATTVTSDLASLLSSDSNFQLETISMKKFVALRDELDGKYDAIYFGNSLFNPTIETGNDHNTRYKENDITLLKANEIKDKYITKGLPVIVYGNSSANRGALYQTRKNDNTRGNLYTLFNPYNTANNQSSVIFVTNTDLASKNAFLTKTKLLTIPTNRPRLTVTSKPVDYTLSANRASYYSPGSTLSYTFDVKNVTNLAQRNLVANLYLGIDSVLSFDATKLVQSVSVTSLTNNTISFTLPKGYSGLYYWRLELVDQTSTGRLKDADSGVFRFKDQAPTINVLQVLPNSQSTAQTSSLLKSSNMTQSYLKTEDYNINLTVIDFTKFNSTEYSTLNSKYDMVIFGFNDSYNGTGNISDTAAAAVKTYITTGQGVMFTHDTVYQGNQTWITNFKEITGQSGAMTNMGLNAPSPSTSTVKVNEGLLTEFPFFISDLPTQVATTHDQYFKLNLEDPTVIPWYNINGSPRDIEDSWNHYYTYSKGNVTYSGTGHNFVNTSISNTYSGNAFPDWEQKLFVNTMYRAFIGSNHKPTLDILSPVAFNATSNNYLSANSDISISFKPDDFDLNDKNLTSSVTFKYRDGQGNNQTQSVLSGLLTKKGETINRSFTNPLAASGGDLTISVSTQDASGALETKEVIVKVITSTSLTPERTISSEKIEVNLPVTVNYVIRPTSKVYSAATNLTDLTISGLHFKEVFPPNLEIVTLPANLTSVTKVGTLATGFTVEGNIPNIPYRKESNQFVADNSSFTIVVKPTSSGDYSLSNANLAYNNFASTTQNVLFSNRVFTAFIKLTNLTLDNLTIAKGDNSKLIPKVLPSNATYKTNEDFTWASDDSSTVTVNGSGEITGLKAGTAHITATAKDGSGLVATSTVSVIQPGLNVTGPTQVAVNSSINLTAALVTANEEVTSKSWSSSDTSVANFTAATVNSFTGVLQGNKKGTVTVTATVVTDKGRTYTKDYVVSVFLPIASVALDNSTIRVGETSQLAANYLPANADFPTFTWGSARTDLVTVDGTGKVTGKAVGSSQITVTSTDGSNKSSNATVTVMQPTLAVNGPTSMNIGDRITLEALFSTVNESVASITWASNDQDKASFVTDGDYKRVLTGLKEGTVNGSVRITTNKGSTYTQTFSVVVKAVPVTSIAINDTRIRVGETAAISPTFFPTNASNKVLTWTSSDLRIVTVDPTNGTIQGVGVGTATITAVTTDGTHLSDTAAITVMQPTFSINGPNKLFIGGNPIGLTASLYTVNESPASVEWDVSDADKLKAGFVTNGDLGRILTGLTPGVVTGIVTVVTDKGNSYEARFTVIVISLILQDKVIDVGETDTMIPSISPAIDLSSNLDWTSSVPNVLTIDPNGNIEAKTVGTSQVQLVTKDDHTVVASSTVTVAQPSVVISGDQVVNVTGTTTLNASLRSSHQEVQSITWELDDPKQSFAIITGSDASRTFTGSKVGQISGLVKIATKQNNTYSQRFNVSVESLSILRVIDGAENDQTMISLDKDETIQLKAVLNPATASNNGFTWSIPKISGDDGEAVITNANQQIVTLRGTKKGTLHIKVDVAGGIGFPAKTATKSVDVRQDLTKLEFTNNSLTLYMDGKQNSFDLFKYLTVTPSKWTDEDEWKDDLHAQLNWSSSNTKSATVTDGSVFGVKQGSTEITVTNKDNPAVKAVIKVQVIEFFDDRY